MDQSHLVMHSVQTEGDLVDKNLNEGDVEGLFLLRKHISHSRNLTRFLKVFKHQDELVFTFLDLYTFNKLMTILNLQAFIKRKEWKHRRWNTFWFVVFIVGGIDYVAVDEDVLVGLKIQRCISLNWTKVTIYSLCNLETIHDNICSISNFCLFFYHGLFFDYFSFFNLVEKTWFLSWLIIFWLLLFESLKWIKFYRSTRIKVFVWVTTFTVYGHKVLFWGWCTVAEWHKRDLN